MSILKTRFEVNAKGLFILHDVVASFPHLSEPSSFDGTAEKMVFSVNGLLEIEDPAYVALKKAIAALMPAKAKVDVSKLPFKEAKKVPESWTEAHGVSAYTVKIVSKTKIRCLDVRGREIGADEIIAGDRISLAFQPYWFENKFGAFCQLQAKAVLRIAPYLEFSTGGGSADASDFGLSASDNEKDANVPSTDVFDDDIPFN